MKGEILQPGDFEAARAEIKSRLFAENDKKLARRKAFYKTFLGKETVSSPEQLPDSLYLPAQALGDIQQAIQRTCEKKREYSQFIRWDPQQGFTPSRLYKGHQYSASRWGNAQHTVHDSERSPSFVALHYHTHPDYPYPARAYYPYPLPIPDTFSFFSDGDIAHTLHYNTPIHLVAMHGCIYGLVQTDMVARSSMQKEVWQKFNPNNRSSRTYGSIADYTRGLHEVGLALYEWQLPLNKFVMANMSFRDNWQRFFIAKEQEAREMRMHGITMTKLIPQPLSTSAPASETHIFGQL